jgi:hypothetical protein
MTLHTSTRRQLIADTYTAVQISRMLDIATALGATPYDQIMIDLYWAFQHTRRLGL